MDHEKFIEEQIADTKQTVGDAKAINALSGGVDSSLTTVLGHRALGNQLKTVFVHNALTRQGERQRIITEIEDVNRCLYDLTPKPPATIEYI